MKTIARVWPAVCFAAMATMVLTGCADSSDRADDSSAQSASETSASDQPPPNEPPHLWRAAATIDDGDVVIQIDRPEYRSPREAGPAEVMEWRPMRSVKLGESIRAFDVDGNPLDPTELAQRLEQPKGVVVFVRYYEPLLDPDPFYLNLLREGTTVLVVAADAVFELAP